MLCIKDIFKERLNLLSILDQRYYHQGCRVFVAANPTWWHGWLLVSTPNLDSPLSLEKITCSVNTVQSNKLPGLDSFPIEFLILANCYNHCSTLWSTLTQASIALLLKKDKDHTACSSFIPLSLLKADIKILAKAISLRLEDVLPPIISQKQNGFIYGHNLFSNSY